VERIQRLDADGFARYVEETGATICGRSPVEVLLRMLPPSAVVSVVGYDTSGRITGDPVDSVSYVALSVRSAWTKGEEVPVEEVPLTASDRATLLALAREAVRRAADGRPPPTLDDLGLPPTPALARPAGVFTTLRRDGELRGCIGEIHAMRPLWRAVAGTAAAAASRDHRFLPIRPDEVEDLDVKVSVLTDPRPIASWRDIELGRHGIVLARSGRTATFLPEVAPEQGWTLEETLTHLARKAGLPADAWREGATFEVFESIVFGGREGEDGPARGDRDG
jgi:AmmeMemoRadiSam system protein A